MHCACTKCIVSVLLLNPVSQRINGRQVSPSGFDTIIAVAFDGEEVFSACTFNQPDMVDAFRRSAVDTEDVGGLNPPSPQRGRIVPPVCFAVRKQGRTPGVARLGEACLPETPGYKGRAPGMAFSQIGVAQVFLYPWSVIVAGGFFYTEFGRSNIDDFPPYPQRRNCRGRDNVFWDWDYNTIASAHNTAYSSKKNTEK